MGNVKKCLVIDDDTDDQELFELALSDLGLGIDCATAYNGIEGLEYLRSNSFPDIIFLDLNMPKMNGMECLKELKSDLRLKEIPVVILSTSTNTVHQAEALNLGAIQFVIKPSSTAELTTILAGIFMPIQNLNINR